MPAPTDPLSSPPPPNRVYFSLGRMLGVEDFQAEQDYHRGRLARALLQLCGTGTVSGLKVRVPQFWVANTFFPTSAYVIDLNGNIEVNTGAAGNTGPNQPVWPSPGNSVNDGASIKWTNQGAILKSGWLPDTQFNYPSAIVDGNNNVQVLNPTSGLKTGPNQPLWSTAIGVTTPDGGNAAAWTCVGPAQLEIQATPGIAIDRAGRIIEVPRAVCIRLQPWMDQQSDSDLNLALHGGNILIDVFATFVACTRGVTPCFATQDDYDATDAFSPNRLLDSFAMQLVLRTDAVPNLPSDPWTGAGPMPPTGGTPTAQSVKQTLLDATSGPSAPATEYPPGFDTTSVFLARIKIPATVAVSGQRPKANLMALSIDNLSRLFLFPGSLAARWAGLSPAN